MHISCAFRNALKTLIVSCALLTAGANAAPILLYESDDVLTGVKNIKIKGQSFNVDFMEGSCDSVFDYCQSRYFLFKDASSANAAARALATQVFGGKDPRGVIPGCTFMDDCWFLTPYKADENWVYVAGFHNATEMPDRLERFEFSKVDSSPNITFARWSTTQEIPEPGAIALFSIALAGLGFVRRKR